MRPATWISSAAAGVRAELDGLRQLNALGYGQAGSPLALHLVYNPQGPTLPPPQASLEEAYRRVLGERHGIVFHRLYALANMPIPTVRGAAAARGIAAELPGIAGQPAPQREPLRRDVPAADQRRLAGLSSTTATSTSSWGWPWSPSTAAVRAPSARSVTARSPGPGHRSGGALLRLHGGQRLQLRRLPLLRAARKRGAGHFLPAGTASTLAAVSSTVALRASFPGTRT